MSGGGKFIDKYLAMGGGLRIAISSPIVDNFSGAI